MSSTFYGLEIAKSGIFASQSALNLTGHNIANANTVGYTRQRLVLVNREPGVGTMHINEVTHALSGAGVSVTGIEQVRDVFLDRQYRAEYSQQQMWDARADALAYVEGLFNETDETGLTQQITAFFNSLQVLQRNPESKEYRTNVQQNAQNMVDTFKQIASQLIDKAGEMDDAVNVTVTQVNDIARNIADLDVQIARFELSGDAANDLRDQRNVLIDNLSALGETTTQEDASGHLTVYFAGEALVTHDTCRQLVATKDKTSSLRASEPDQYSVTWADTGDDVVTSVGKLRAYQDMRDGNSDSVQGVPYYLHELDALAAGIASAFNDQHEKGFTLPDDSNGNTSVNGVDFFDETVPVNASNFALSAAVRSSVFNIAAAGATVTSTTRGDADNALKLYEMQNTPIAGLGTIESYYTSMTASMGLEISHTNQMRDAETVLTDNISNLRTSVSGVSMDEEMANLVRFQHAYSASARVITTIDEALDTLINKTGVVGR